MTPLAAAETVRLVDRPQPGDLGAMVALQARHYAKSHGFGLAFETRIAGDMAEFLGRYDGDRDLYVTVRRGETVLGGLTLDATCPGDGDLAHLRWIFLNEEVRGRGFARTMLARAIDRARSLEKAGLYLTTIADLDAAARLYRAAGFAETARETAATWGRAVTEVRMDLTL